MQVELILMAKQPVAGKVKTRLNKALNNQQIAMLADGLLKHACQQMLASKAFKHTISVWPDAEHEYWQSFSCCIEQQIDGDLGEKMAALTARSLQSHDAVMFMGMDCPELSADMLNQMIDSLSTYDVVIRPALDGGYVSIAMKQPYLQLFQDMPWSQPNLLDSTIDKLEELAIHYQLLTPLRDIDEPEDLAFLPENLKEVIQHVG